MLILAAFLIVIAIFILWQARQRQKSLGMPAGRVIYVDTRAWGKVEQPLYDPVLSLVGRPDYLVEQGDRVIPVEVKSSRITDAPYDAHIYQLAAYCLLVQRLMGKRPPYGILHYPNRTLAIDYTSQLEASLLALLEEMRTQDRHKEVARSHDSGARCQSCGYRSICDQRLH